MNRLTLAGLTLLVVVAVAGCDDNPNDPSDANNPQFASELLPGNEVVAPAAADLNGRGTVVVTFHVTRDASQNVTAATADFVVNLSGFATGASLTGAHIHPGRAGVNGGVVIGLPSVAGEVLANGSGSLSRTGVAISPVDLAQQVINDPAAFYFNVHTTTTPAGAVRGQLVAQ